MGMQKRRKFFPEIPVKKLDSLLFFGIMFHVAVLHFIPPFSHTFKKPLFAAPSVSLLLYGNSKNIGNSVDEKRLLRYNVLRRVNKKRK